MGIFSSWWKSDVDSSSKPEYSITSYRDEGSVRDGSAREGSLSKYYAKQFFRPNRKGGRSYSSADVKSKGGLYITKNSSFYQVWFLFMVVASLYSTIFTPLQFGFFRGLPRGLWLSDLCVQAIFLADILIKFVTAYRDPITYRVIGDHKSIAKRYARKDFIIELLACLPWDTIYKGTGHHEPVRYFVWIRLYRLKNVERFFVKVEKNVRINYFAARIIKLLAVELFCTHVAACFYYYLATRLPAHREGYTWIGSLTFGSMSYSNFREIGLGKRYVTALYWAVLTMTTVGYGDIHAVNPREMVFCMIYVSFDMILGAYLIGNMSALIVKGSNTEKFRDKMASLTKFMNRNRLPHHIRKQMKNHVKLQFESGIMAADEAVDNLPVSIRHAVAHSLYGNVVENVQIFKGCSAEFMNEIVGKVSEEHYLPGEVIIHQGGPPSQFYIVCDGALEQLLVQEDGKVEVVELFNTPSAVFGEVGVLCNIPQPFTVRVTDLCKILRIDTRAFNDVVQIYFNDGRLVINNLLELRDADAPVGQIAADVTFLVAKHAAELALMVNNASYQGDLAQLKHLVKQGAIVAKPDYDGRTPLHLAASKGFEAVCLYLIREGADINAVDKFGMSPLLESVKGGHDQCSAALVNQGAQLRLQDPGSYLCQAVKSGNEDMLRRLLVSGADVNASDYDKRTALHIASAEGATGIAQVLVDFGADPNAEDRWGRTPLDEAEHHDNQPLIPLLKDAVHKKKTPGEPAGYAAQRERVGSIDYASSTHSSKRGSGRVAQAIIDRQSSSGRRAVGRHGDEYRMLPMRGVGRPPAGGSPSSGPTRRRATIFPYHPWTPSNERTAGKFDWVPPSIHDILDLASQNFGKHGVKVLNQDGGEISSTDFIMDGEKVYVVDEDDLQKGGSSPT